LISASVSGTSKRNATINNKVSQKPYKVNKHKDAINRYSLSKKPAIVTKYFVPPLSPQFGNSPSSFPPPAAPYQQYPGPAPPQPFTPQPTPYQPNQQFGASGPQYPYNQQPPQQPYRAPPAAAQYGPGYQAPPYNQHPQANGPPQFAGPNYPNATQQYGPPQPQKPYQQPQSAYPAQNGSFPANLASIKPFQAPSQTWNAPPVPASRAPPYQRPQRNYSDSSFNSGTPGFQSQSHQGSVERAGSQSYQQTPRTPSSNVGSAQHQTPRPCQSSPATAPSLSKVSSTSSTPYARLGALDNDVIKEIKPEPLVDDKEKEAASNKEQDEQEEDGEVPEEDEEEDDEEAIFVWECEAIFLDPPRLETVALAQPLSTNFGMTPVPLLDPNSKNSVSRYARKENLKEFIKPITMSPQWSYLKEDPAFADIKSESQLIPLCDLPAWITARHGLTIVVEELLQPSRKRSHSIESRCPFQEEGEQEQEDVNHQIALETGSELQTQGPPSKRIKSELTDDEMSAAPTTVHVTSPINMGRAGTPCLTTEDDAWGPDPGEVAAPPMSPTEALLASLGVTGAPKPPKPAKEGSLPPYQGEETQQTPYSSGPSPNPSVNQPAPQVPVPNFQGSQPPMNTNYGGSLPPQSNFTGPPSNPPFPNNQARPPTYGPPANPPYTNGPQPQAQSAPRPNNFQNGVPANNGFNNSQYPNQQYEQPIPQQNGGPQYGPPAPQQNGNQQYRPPVNPAFGNGTPVNGQYGTGPQGPSQYGNAPPQNAPYNGQQYNQGQQYNKPPAGPYGQQGNPQFGNGPPTQQPYGPPQGTPQFATGPPSQQPYSAPQQQGPNPQFSSGPPPQQQYGAPQGNPQFSNGPPNHQQYNAMPQGNPQFGNGPPPQQQYGVGQQGNPQFGNGPPPQQQQYGVAPQSNPQFGNGPPNQQQQYGSAPQGNPQYPNAQQQQQQHGPPQNNLQFSNAPPAQHQQQQPQSYSSTPQSNGASRQDSGYASAHRSYSNGPSSNGLNTQENIQAQGQQPYYNGGSQPPQVLEPPHPENFHRKRILGREDNSDGSGSLSPDSREILGKLVGTDTRKMSNGRTYEIKLKKPAPVVEAAYRYGSISAP
jgi:hypothetical protein